MRSPGSGVARRIGEGRHRRPVADGDRLCLAAAAAGAVADAQRDEVDAGRRDRTTARSRPRRRRTTGRRRGPTPETSTCRSTSR